MKHFCSSPATQTNQCSILPPPPSSAATPPQLAACHDISKMHHHHHHVLFIFFFLLVNSLKIQSEIRTFKISTDPRPLILLQDFGFSNPGFISISISSISITTNSINPKDHPSLMGCFYAPAPARRTIELALLNRFCLIGKPMIFPIFTFSERTLLSTSSKQKTIHITIPDLYYIFFVNCAINTSVSMDVNLATYNVERNGHPDYIDEHFANLPSTLDTFSFVYFVFLVAWLNLCVKNKPFAHKIHVLMAVLLFLRFLDLFCYAKTQHSIRLTGSARCWNALWLAVCFARNLLFTNVVVLIGSGWSLLRPCLQEFQEYVMAIAVSLQLVASLCFVLMRGVGTYDKYYKYWVVIYYAFDFICCMTMLLPVLKSIEDLRIYSRTEGKNERKLAQLRVFKNYGVAIHAYFGSSRLGMFLLRSITSYQFLYVSIVVELGVELLFYIVVYVMFWPNERNDYVVLGDREEEFESTTPVYGSKVDNI